ncbi:MAG: hypothetical protein Q9163_000482 [Psora crenata]
MSYYFCIVNSRDQPLFELEFGTSKQGGDGIARFSQEARHMNPYIVHSSLDLADDVQWTNSQMYLKRIDHFASSYISCFLTPTSTRFLLLHLPHPPNTAPQTKTSPMSFPPFVPYTSIPSTSTTTAGSHVSGTGGSSTSIPNNPTSQQTEEAIRQFFGEVFEVWIKANMSPFQSTEGKLRSPVFRQRAIAAGKKYL